MTAQPLDPHTLRVVIERLQWHIDGREQSPLVIPTESVHSALVSARMDIESILATASDRARVVVLPEPTEISGGGSRAVWAGASGSDVYTVATYSPHDGIRVNGYPLTKAAARARALAMLAATEYPGGIQ